jgi:hypothetical protein
MKIGVFLRRFPDIFGTLSGKHPDSSLTKFISLISAEFVG